MLLLYCFSGIYQTSFTKTVQLYAFLWKPTPVHLRKYHLLTRFGCNCFRILVRADFFFTTLCYIDIGMYIIT